MANRNQKPVINKELAENARQMVEFGFWKYLDRFMGEMAREATDYEDSLSHGQITPGDIGYARGIRTAVKKIREEVEQHTK